MKISEQSSKIKDLLRINVKRSNIQIGDYVTCVRDTLATGKKTSITKNNQYRVLRIVGKTAPECDMSIGVRADDGIQRTFTQSFFNIVD